MSRQRNHIVKREIKRNSDTRKESEERLAAIRTNISTIELQTKPELDALMEAFYVKHGLRSLYDEQEILTRRIQSCQGINKYGGCCHPFDARIKAAKGWRSESWECTVCGYEDIDWIGPGN